MGQILIMGYKRKDTDKFAYSVYKTWEFEYMTVRGFTRDITYDFPSFNLHNHKNIYINNITVYDDFDVKSIFLLNRTLTNIICDGSIDFERYWMNPHNLAEVLLYKAPNGNNITEWKYVDTIYQK